MHHPPDTLTLKITTKSALAKADPPRLMCDAEGACAARDAEQLRHELWEAQSPGFCTTESVYVQMLSQGFKLGLSKDISIEACKSVWLLYQCVCGKRQNKDVGQIVCMVRNFWKICQRCSLCQRSTYSRTLPVFQIGHSKVYLALVYKNIARCYVRECSCFNCVRKSFSWGVASLVS